MWSTLQDMVSPSFIPLLISNLYCSLLIIRLFTVFGGMVSGSVVSSPAADDWRLTDFAPVEWTITAQYEHWLKISIKSIEIPDERDENNIDVDQRDTLKGLVVNI